MDVTPVSGPTRPGTPDQIRRPSDDVAHASATGDAAKAQQQHSVKDGAAATAAKAAKKAQAAEASAETPQLSPALEALVKAASPDSSMLKFNVEKADVLAKFQIDQTTNHVVVTMYQRGTGEVIRQFPPRHVLDVMAALAGRGLAVDVST